MFGNLRLVPTDKLNEYRSNTDLFLTLGNQAFAATLREGRAKATSNPYHAP